MWYVVRRRVRNCYHNKQCPGMHKAEESPRGMEILSCGTYGMVTKSRITRGRSLRVFEAVDAKYSRRNAVTPFSIVRARLHYRSPHRADRQGGLGRSSGGGRRRNWCVVTSSHVPGGWSDHQDYCPFFVVRYLQGFRPFRGCATSLNLRWDCPCP